tara:strand:- start:395 stop:1459 length:1065 start_codon:yes stop_codon:yes gene_type:complete
MNVTDKLYTEWAWRSKTGTPDINDPEDKALLDSIIAELTEQTESPYSQLQTNISKIQDDPEAVDFLNRYVNNRRFRAPFDEYIANQNIDSSTLEDTDAPDAIFNILSKNGDLETYMNNLDKLPGFESLDTSGNLVTALDSIVSKESANALIRLGGMEGGRGVGKAELGIATLCKDVQMMKGQAGDLNWNGYLEVKGTAARLGKRDHEFTGGKKLIDLATANDIENVTQGRTSIYNAPEILASELLKKGVDQNTILTALKDDFGQVYSEKALKLIKNIKDLSVEMRLAYFTNYWFGEGVKHIIFVATGNNGFGNYLSFNYDQAIEYIKKNPTGFCSPIRYNQLAPQVFRSGIKVK